MKLLKWEKLPTELQTEAVRRYYDILQKKKTQLVLKRAFDIAVSLILLIVLSPVFLVLAVAIKLDTRGPVFYRQTRVTQYGRHFRIHKFRSMVQGADKGSLVTVGGDSRVTATGRLIRRCRLDEISQLIDVLRGDMTFVGTRPEVPKFVEGYTEEMKATLLLPAGVTSLASIYYKDEDRLLEGAEDPDSVYLQRVLPEKMFYNLRAIREFSLPGEMGIMVKTVLAVLGKEYRDGGTNGQSGEQ